ncbi:MAG: hypothetical protein EOP50_14325 [Sphingobacteriales bacterium]|nr:MAG: hypothetical protein EOP50_14325 [Sphingobacteriales bacterium]
MKKILMLTLLFSAAATTMQALTTNQAAAAQPATEKAKPQEASATTASAQGGDWAAMLQQAKDKIRPQMMEKTGLTAAQADRVVEINWEMRQTAGRVLQGLTESERSAKIAELKLEKEKKMKDLLTPEQIKAVASFYEDMGRNMQQKAGN